MEDSFKISKLCSLANLANLANLASKKCPNPRKCWDSPDSPTFANQFGKDSPDLPTFTKQFGRTRQTCRHLSKAIFEKNVTRLAKFAQVLSESRKFGTNFLFPLPYLKKIAFSKNLFYNLCSIILAHY
jgi:hypothetical protein